jgi:hypothetical protein
LGMPQAFKNHRAFRPRWTTLFHALERAADLQRFFCSLLDRHHSACHSGTRISACLGNPWKPKWRIPGLAC